eukprot:CAMPEP_0113520992 /NCGR_PEP_ID=MMETSP0014_2-20120614/44398_1 /TAXON_ID=2857 /ORGANISM="Nitzschia sp." /LENGTH=517 /DNA_ID=CAMNT_0000418913 /DNA_START=69 /DNA_END=1622 /DNA_ORIENTATION=+ /assembly_acc=CAM_ASM_000159
MSLFFFVVTTSAFLALILSVRISSPVSASASASMVTNPFLELIQRIQNHNHHHDDDVAVGSEFTEFPSMMADGGQEGDGAVNDDDDASHSKTCSPSLPVSLSSPSSQTASTPKLNNSIDCAPKTTMNTDSGTKKEDTTSATTSSSPSSSPLFSAEQHQAFQRDGFLVISGLLDGTYKYNNNGNHQKVGRHNYVNNNEEGSLLARLVQSGDEFVSSREKMDAYFSSIEMGMIFNGGPTTNVTDTFRKVAIESIIPTAAAELLQLDPEDDRLYILRDVFMSYAVESNSSCDWHVDDVGFWPQDYQSDVEGLNVWIALEDMPREAGGSMALAPASHKAEWRHDAYDSIGLNLTFQGGFTKSEAKQMKESGVNLLMTCEMGKQAPEIREQVEATKYIPDIKKGDVIFATRFLFHRTHEVSQQGKSYYANRGISQLNRYSIRYGQSKSRLPSGWTFEWSIMHDKDIEGKTLREAEGNDLAWYPRAWPSMDPNQLYKDLPKEELEAAKVKSRSELFELFKIFQ